VFCSQLGCMVVELNVQVVRIPVKMNTDSGGT
jgi:hypothetical protein